MHRLLFVGGLALAVLFCSITPAFAVFYGASFDGGGDVTFLNVSDLNGLYGPPVATGNVLDFSPTGFEVDCPNAGQNCPPQSAVATDTLTFQIDADPGFFIEDILLTEAGDTLITDFDIPGGFAATTVVANVVIDVFEIDGVSVGGVNGNAAMVFTNGGTFDTDNDPNGVQVWTGLLALDVDAVIANAGESGKATLVQISLSNELTAFAENGAEAMIEKKDIDGLAITVIPEPGTALLLGLGVMALAARGRCGESGVS